MRVQVNIKPMPPILALALMSTMASAASYAEGGKALTGSVRPPSVADVTSWPAQSFEDFLAKAQTESLTLGRQVDDSRPKESVPSPGEEQRAKVSPSRTELPLASKRHGGETPERVARVVVGAAAPGEQVSLKIAETPAGLVFSPERLVLSNVGSIASLSTVGNIADLALFVRDSKVLDLRKASGQLAALKQGTTELYAFAKGRMYIVPVVIGGKANGTKWDLSVPQSLVSLNGVLPSQANSAQYPTLEKATTAQTDAPTLDPSAGFAKTGSDPFELSSAAPSLNESIADTTQAMMRQAQEAQRYYNAKDKVSYRAVTLQIIDDRSDPSAGKIYPVVGATVQVLGTEFVAQTDATGHLTIRDMPQKSHFLLKIDDGSGQIRPALAELPTQSKEGVVRIRTMRSLIFDAVTSIAGSVQQSGLGSYCATVSDVGADKQRLGVAGVGVQIDVPAEGPFFFNNYGFLDRSMTSTGPDGRFCYFNATPGPAGLTVYRDQAPVSTLAVSVFAGRHAEDDIKLDRETEFTVNLASMATAQEQLGSDPAIASSYKLVDMIDMIPFGTQNPMMQLAPGKISTSEAVLSHHGRQRVYARAAEFEPVVYTYNADDEQKVAPLIPRGFIEDMSLYAQVSQDPELGSVLVEYSAPEGASRETVSMRLVDQNGHDTGDGWYFSDTPMTKAIFFNLPAGTYSLQVQTKDGYWLSSDTVIVYNETTSFMRLGNSLHYRDLSPGAKSS